MYSVFSTLVLAAIDEAKGNLLSSAEKSKLPLARTSPEGNKRVTSPPEHPLKETNGSLPRPNIPWRKQTGHFPARTSPEGNKRRNTRLENGRGKWPNATIKYRHTRRHVPDLPSRPSQSNPIRISLWRSLHRTHFTCQPRPNFHRGHIFSVRKSEERRERIN